MSEVTKRIYLVNKTKMSVLATSKEMSDLIIKRLTNGAKATLLSEEFSHKVGDFKTHEVVKKTATLAPMMSDEEISEKSITDRFMHKVEL